jgi:O-acetyl-ADP-ribose deacetylase (regulator of RNase III)
VHYYHTSIINMKCITGDLIELARRGRFDVIVHGCNCLHAMDAGIALAIKENFPEAYEADLKTPFGDSNKLGTCSVATHQLKNKTLFIINAYTQFNWQGEGILLDYEALRSCMRWINQNFPGKQIGIPKIGAGLAKGDWNIIEKIILEEMRDGNVSLITRK